MKNQKYRKVSYDCQYYLGDRPCVYHKKVGVVCECENYVPIKGNILIIKLDAMGDVLRTTCLLPGIRREYAEMVITWITRKESVPLLEMNPYIHEIVQYGPDAIVHLSARAFDLMINLDAGKISASLGAMAQAKKKFGYVLNPAGYVTGTNEAAVEWLKMGIFDDLKRANQRTYQDIMCSILSLPSENLKYILKLSEDEKETGCRYLQQLGLDLKKKIIGIHTGGGGRWIHKQWTQEGFIGLIPELYKEVGGDVQILLFGGPLERERNKRILSEVGCKVYDAGCDNEVRHFAALVNKCSVVISADSLAMHIALAMGCRVVVLFGPTSHAEIELFGFGEKVIPDKDCLVCYKLVCDCKPNCMESITIDNVKQAVHRQLSLS